MKVQMKGNNIALSQASIRDVSEGILIKYKKVGGKILKTAVVDVHKGQKQYGLPFGLTKRDVTKIYIRIL